MSKRKRDKARFQRQIQSDINILLGYPRNLFRTPEGSTSTFKGDEEYVRDNWKAVKHNYTINDTTGTLYVPDDEREMEVLGGGVPAEAEPDNHRLVVEVQHAEGTMTHTYEAATYSACARKAWGDLRDFNLGKDDQVEVDRGDFRTHWQIEADFEIDPDDFI